MVPVSWIVRIPPVAIDSPGPEGGQTEAIGLESSIALTLWDLGTTGLADVNGELIAGFDDHHRALNAAAVVASVIGREPAVHAVAQSNPPASSRPMLFEWRGQRHEMHLDSDGVFGHGRHPTTQLGLDLLLGHLGQRRPATGSIAPMRILDVGTGTGVLAIAAALTGEATVTAIDIEDRARSAARANAEANGTAVAVLDATADELAHSGQTYDLILANVLLTDHRKLAGPILRLLGVNRAPDHNDTGPGGLAILSGYLAHQVSSVIDLYRPADAEPTLVAAAYRGEWAGHVLRIEAPYQPASADDR